MIYGMSPPIPVWTHSDDMSADPADPQKHLYDVDNGECSYRDIVSRSSAQVSFPDDTVITLTCVLSTSKEET